MPHVSNAELNQLLASARAGDDEANNRLWDQLRNYLLVIADQNLNGDLRKKIDASDIVQQSLFEAQFDFAAFKGDGDILRAWLRTVVENNVTDAWRRFSNTQMRDISREQSLAAAVVAHPGQLTASVILEHRETDEQLSAAMQCLSPRRQRVIELRHRQGLCFADIATEMGLTEVAARQLYSRGIKELRKKLSYDQVQ